jgi:hypothetical protein
MISEQRKMVPTGTAIVNEAGEKIRYPRVYLVIDNCFACKRWTKPEEWCGLIAEAGVNYAEANADTELDPLFMGREYLTDWIESVKKAQDTTGVRVVNLYSGHGTYTTLGLTHTDPRVRRRMIEYWFKPMMETAGRLGAGLGFFAHGFPHHVLQNAALYRESVDILVQCLVELNRHAASCGCGKMSIEQMYTPHQYPWTIAQTRDLIRTVTEQSGDFYFTEDVGHHQGKFIKPDNARIRCLAEETWLGSDRAFELAERGDLAGLEAEIENTPWLFAGEKDSDCYAWLSELGCYSPIIHLQQTNGRMSAHLPFTAEQNRQGIIDGGKVLKALKSAYDKPPDRGMPKRCEEIYMTLELFSPTAAIVRDLMAEARESAAYWRHWIPRDGMYLDELTARFSEEA